MRTGQVLGFLLALSLDSLIPGQGLHSVILHILQMDNTNIDTTLCSSIYSCSVGGLITFWMVIFMGYILFDLQQTGFLLNCWKKLTFTSNLTQQQRGFYSTLPTSELTSIENEQKEQIPSVHRQRTFNYPNALEYNYFDPDNIPDQLAPYSETIFTVAQQLCCSHGFQIDNSRNQAEHMLMLLFNETAKEDDMVSIPAQRLHVQMFANYRKWCIRMNVKSNLLKDISILFFSNFTRLTFLCKSIFCDRLQD